MGDFCFISMEKQNIYSKIEEIVEQNGFLLIDVIHRGDAHLKIIEVYFDGERGINTDDCMKVSRIIEEMIDTEKLIVGKYRLDVSSPGVDRPLKYLAQYSKHINRSFEVEFLSEGLPKNYKAKLIRVNGEELFFMIKDSEIKINFNEITKAKVLISF
jgi:ribosome maturation factor RimP